MYIVGTSLNNLVEYLIYTKDQRTPEPEKAIE